MVRNNILKCQQSEVKKPAEDRYPTKVNEKEYPLFK